MSEETIEQIREIAAERQCRLLAVETAGAGRFSVLRVVLERLDGGAITVDDCEAVSREASALLDATDEIPHRYTLEVSSPGLERKLYSLDDAQRFVGRRVRVKSDAAVIPVSTASPEPALRAPAKNFHGVLAKVEGDVLTIVDEAERKTYNVRFADIRLARLEFEWPERGRQEFGSR